MIDPSRCPIPPDFEINGNISDDFKLKKTTTSYSNGEYGYSRRWRNNRIRAANIVAGFQFKIGPCAGKRWKYSFVRIKKVLYPESQTNGDVNLKFPRTEASTNKRGIYMLSLKWYEEGHEVNGLKSEGKVGKELPHNTYGHGSLKAIPKPEIGQIRDGK